METEQLREKVRLIEWEDQIYNKYELSLIEIVNLFWNGRKLIFTACIFTTTIALVYLSVATKIYVGSVTVMPVEADNVAGLASLAGQFGGLASAAGLDIGGAGGSKADEALATLSSHAFCAGFIEELELRPILFSSRWNNENKQWNNGGEDEPTVIEACDKFRKNLLKVVNDTKTGLIYIEMHWRDPEQASDWANLIVTRVNKKIRDRDVQEAEAVIAYLNLALTETSIVELQQSIFRLIESQMNTAILAKVREQYALRIIDHAYEANRPSSPNAIIVIILAAFGGLGLGCVIVLFNATKASLELDEAAARAA